MRARPVLVAFTCAMVLLSGSASAAPLTDRQVAQSLFDQARELMAKSDYAKACPMLAESQRLDPGGGTLLNLALCYESEGKLATAQLALNDALSQAAKDGRADREAIAREHLTALGPRVPKLALVAPATRVRGLVVELDGVTMGSAASGVALPVDPGTHEVRASAPGHVTWTSSPTLREGESRRLQLPDLLKVGAVATRPAAALATPEPESSPAPAGPPKKLATASYVFAGVGAASLVASIVTGVMALNDRSDFEHRCFVQRGFCANASDADLAGTARNLAWVSTGLLVVAVGAGVAAWFWPRVTTDAGSAAQVRPGVFVF